MSKPHMGDMFEMPVTIRVGESDRQWTAAVHFRRDTSRPNILSARVAGGHDMLPLLSRAQIAAIEDAAIAYVESEIGADIEAPAS